MKESNDKIVSRFYVIYGDNTPIYVGYTNRTIKQRFNEHKKDKDFSNYSKVEVKEVDRLEFDFTWDMIQVNENAKQVSNRESMLIKQYGTINSLYQKGFGDIQGGQTWASVKGFVHSNRNNPKYIGMSNEELLGYLDNYHKKTMKLHNFINHYQGTRIVKLSNFVNHYQDTRLDKLRSFISHYQSERLNKLHTFIGHYTDPRIFKLHNFITNYQDPRILKLHNFINLYQDPRIIKLHNFIAHYQNYNLSKLQNFMNAYQDRRVLKLKTFISHYKDCRLDKLSNFIGRYRDTRLDKLHNFIGRYK